MWHFDALHPVVNTFKVNMQFDVFISHASEDKDSVARPLARRLQELDVKVWLDEFELTLGDSLRKSIDHGLSQSRFGIVVLSRNFFKKDWPQRELDGLAAREEDNRKVILPVWHNITKSEIIQASPTLADRLAISTSKGIDAVAQEVFRVVKKSAGDIAVVAKPEPIAEKSKLANADLSGGKLNPPKLGKTAPNVKPLHLRQSSEAPKLPNHERNIQEQRSDVESQQVLIRKPLVRVFFILFALLGSVIIIWGLFYGFNRSGSPEPGSQSGPTPEVMKSPSPQATPSPTPDIRPNPPEAILKGCTFTRTSGSDAVIDCAVFNNFKDKRILSIKIEIDVPTPVGSQVVIKWLELKRQRNILSHSAENPMGWPLLESHYDGWVAYKGARLRSKKIDVYVKDPVEAEP